MQGEGNELLERLDAFFGEGANIDAIGNFFSEEYNIVQRLEAANDSSEALEFFSLFKRYGALVNTILETFGEREAASGSAVSLEQLAEAVMKEWQQPQDFCRYLCTGYIAGALDFDSFKQLVADVVALTTYPVGDEISEDEAVSVSGSIEEDDNEEEDA
ncbi:hypothetical protein DPX39_090058000 [Trypanosoma brucei equiperdum]|uniref:BART domain-containing protein n=1 Tax=Trypanosoma brucei equiperdum TaxID=630700 RepID=A0A3L6L434_9TRYP|nr:hypothetical protein DPX39_090058000 [Trypanosoma brucei equiperdum]